MPKIKINTFGRGIEIMQLNLDPEMQKHWLFIAARTNRSLPDLLLDPFFYYSLKNPKIKELSDIDAHLINGMLNTSKSQVEIWFNRRKALKIQSNDLFNDLVLFPLFQINRNYLSELKPLEKGFYIIQKTIGLLRSEQLEVTCENIDINNFAFTIDRHQTEYFLTGITYKRQNFNFIKSDNVITYQSAFEIK